MDDTERRLNILFDGLNNETVPKEGLDKMHAISKGEQLEPRTLLISSDGGKGCKRCIGAACGTVDDCDGGDDCMGGESGQTGQPKSLLTHLQPGVKQLIRLGL